MNSKQEYDKIVEYLNKKDWSTEPVKGTFCPGRTKEINNIQVVTVSASIQIPEPDKYSNIIVNKSSDGVGSITLGFLTGRSFKSRKEVYRIDHNDKIGWHLDSKKYGIKHQVLKEVDSWEDAIDLMIARGDKLPLEVVDKDKFKEMTDPENMMKW